MSEYRLFPETPEEAVFKVRIKTKPPPWGDPPVWINYGAPLTKQKEVMVGFDTGEEENG